ncbi:M16 family metallopeptidase [Sphingomonas hylomeconis]|uniref:M16 family metallopeptidase n=1 Tax=Sphingomonas hylomeconis TaxID=1395958 RepID=A0ABV7SXV0_9SPHN|nr:insulinase family protein [Sphingomonas hylomeconis]
MQSMSRSSWRLSLLALFALCPAAQTKAAPSGSDWRPVVTGRLENGVRYAILPRSGKEPGTGLLVRNEGGFIAERRPGERGLAHLIEHLLLVSPTTDAPDEVRHFIRIGLPLTFPAPSAGTTSWRETNYFLSTRTTTAADLGTLLGLFRGAATDLIFRADMVDEQRADVMREMAGRKPGNDVYASYIAAVAPQSPNDRIDAQNSDDVPTASIATIRGLYQRLYRPENMMIVVVGNVDAARVRALIEQRFGDWKADPAAAAPPAPMFKADRIRPISFAAQPQGRRTALISVVMPTPAPPASRRVQAERMLMDMLATRAVNDRLARAQPAGPAGKVGMFIDNGEQGHRQIMLWDNFAGDAWRPAIAGLRRMTCDLATTGFSDEEWRAAKQGVIRELEQRAGAMATVPNVDLAKDLSHALAAGEALIPPDEMLQRAVRWLPKVGTRTGGDWWQAQWRAGREHLRVELPEFIGVGDPEGAIRATADGADPRCKIRQ